MSRKPPTPATVPTANANGYNETLANPVPGHRISSPFGTRRDPFKGVKKEHKGIDIAAPTGTAVRASASGTVTFAGSQGGFGNRVVIRHDKDTETTYSHLSEITVRSGQTVRQGEIIGRVGSTGRSTGPHLHFEVVENGVKVDPASALGQSTNVNLNDRTADANREKDSQEAAGKRITDNEFARRSEELKYNQEELIRKMISGEHFQENAANRYQNLTYHWRLFATVDQDLMSGIGTEDRTNTMSEFYNNISQLKQVTIAETGVTGFNIDSVTISSVVGTDYLSGSTLFQNFEINITEPNGVSFLDALRNAAIECDTRNYQKCFYYLELTFKGYEENGDINLAPFKDDVPNGGKWLWSLILSDIDVNLTAGGGTYTLSLINQNDSFTASRLNVLPYSTTVKGDTLGSFMDELCNRLNLYYAKTRGSQTIKFKTKFHPIADLMTADEVRAIPLSYELRDFNETRSEGMAPAEKAINENEILLNSEQRTAHIPAGFAISDVLDTMMRSCETAQKLATDTKINAFYVNEQNERVNATGIRKSIIFRVEPEVRHPNYDPIFNEYYKDVTIHIYGFRHHTTVLSSYDTFLDTDAQKAILADLAARNFLTKKYDYLFTGLNTEVLEMDLSFKLNWAALIPRFVEASAEQVETQALARERGPNEKDSLPRDENTPPNREEIGAAITQAGIVAGEDVDIANEQEALRRRLQQNEITQEQFNEEMKKLNQRAAANAKRRGEIAELRILRERLQAARPYTAPSRNYERLYGEALEINRFQGEDRDQVFPITIDFADVDNATGLSGQYHPGKSIYGAVLNQVYGPVSSKLMRQEITIRGDPYWIGPGSFELAVMRASDLFENKWPNFSQGCNTILFRMSYPLGQDDAGNLILASDESVTGVYQVTNITHKFDNGLFTQVLKCIRVPLIDLYKTLFDNIYRADEKKTDGE